MGSAGRRHVGGGVVSGAKPRVLCVDDDTALLEGLRRSLRRAFQVETAPSGSEGLVAVEAGLALDPFHLERWAHVLIAHGDVTIPKATRTPRNPAE